jgi:hypothetical protein
MIAPAPPSIGASGNRAWNRAWRACAVCAPPPSNRAHRAPPYKGVRGGVRGRRAQRRASGAPVVAPRWGGWSATNAEPRQRGRTQPPSSPPGVSRYPTRTPPAAPSHVDTHGWRRPPLWRPPTAAGGRFRSLLSGSAARRAARPTAPSASKKEVAPRRSGAAAALAGLGRRRLRRQSQAEPSPGRDTRSRRQASPTRIPPRGAQQAIAPTAAVVTLTLSGVRACAVRPAVDDSQHLPWVRLHDLECRRPPRTLLGRVALQVPRPEHLLWAQRTRPLQVGLARIVGGL